MFTITRYAITNTMANQSDEELFKLFTNSFPSFYGDGNVGDGNVGDKLSAPTPMPFLMPFVMPRGVPGSMPGSMPKCMPKPGDKQCEYISTAFGRCSQRAIVPDVNPAYCGSCSKRKAVREKIEKTPPAPIRPDFGVPKDEPKGMPKSERVQCEYISIVAGRCSHAAVHPTHAPTYCQICSKKHTVQEKIRKIERQVRMEMAKELDELEEADKQAAKEIGEQTQKDEHALEQDERTRLGM